MVRGLDVSLSADGGYVVMTSVLGSSIEVRRASDLELVFREYNTFSTPHWLTETIVAWRRKHPAGIFMREVGGPATPTHYARLPKVGVKEILIREGHFVYRTGRGDIFFDGKKGLGPGDRAHLWISGGLAGYSNWPHYRFSDGRSFETPGDPYKVRFLHDPHAPEGAVDLHVVVWSSLGVVGTENGRDWFPLGLPDVEGETDASLVEAGGVVWLATITFDAARNMGVAHIRPWGATQATYQVDFSRFVHSWDMAYDADHRQLVIAVEGNYHAVQVHRLDLPGEGV